MSFGKRIFVDLFFIFFPHLSFCQPYCLPVCPSVYISCLCSPKDPSYVVDTTASSMAMEYGSEGSDKGYSILTETKHWKVIIVMDSISMLQKIKQGLFYTDWWWSLISRGQDHHLAVFIWPLKSPWQRKSRRTGRGDSMTFDQPIVLAVV